ncbi:Endogenous inhibitor of DNA gyrase, YacG/DUF329 family [Gulbenkiania indica]|uniref:DNA gyrase inhibitor YacG n=1 Tax=Gulbenkiania indica TaxID=375574 RepID=A0A0K6GSS8_9NEIS|nr:DNA gyrase inhibitor YacG [Gulbenkiania indica]CUA81682.1 Endogenous inhibitor of DNA gyrase, YacG/DUF329 family [Gulbenkiania indica]
MTSSSPAATVVACPICRTPVEWGAHSPYRPFCSERCKLIDLGQWAEERYRVAASGDEPPSEGPDTH